MLPGTPIFKLAAIFSVNEELQGWLRSLKDMTEEERTKEVKSFIDYQIENGGEKDLVESISMIKSDFGHQIFGELIEKIQDEEDIKLIEMDEEG